MPNTYLSCGIHISTLAHSPSNGCLGSSSPPPPHPTTTYLCILKHRHRIDGCQKDLFLHSFCFVHYIKEPNKAVGFIFKNSLFVKFYSFFWWTYLFHPLCSLCNIYILFLGIVGSIIFLFICIITPFFYWVLFNIPWSLSAVCLLYVMRRKIRLIECNAKCRYLKKSTCKVTLRQVFYLSEVSSPPLTPYSPPLTHCIRVYSILIHTTQEGGELTREKVRGVIAHKSGRKY